MHYFVQGSNKTSRTPESMNAVDDTGDFEHALDFFRYTHTHTHTYTHTHTHRDILTHTHTIRSLG